VAMTPTPQPPRGLLSPPPTSERRTDAQRLDILEAKIDRSDTTDTSTTFFRIDPGPLPHPKRSSSRESAITFPRSPSSINLLRYPSYPPSRRIVIDSDSDSDILPSDSDDKPKNRVSRSAKSLYDSDDNDDLEFDSDDDDNGHEQMGYGTANSDDIDGSCVSQSELSAEDNTNSIDIGSHNDSQYELSAEEYDNEPYDDPYNDGADSGVEYHFAGTGTAWVN
jgi:hypothetical protein